MLVLLVPADSETRPRIRSTGSLVGPAAQLPSGEHRPIEASRNARDSSWVSREAPTDPGQMFGFPRLFSGGVVQAAVRLNAHRGVAD